MDDNKLLVGLIAIDIFDLLEINNYFINLIINLLYKEPKNMRTDLLNMMSDNLKHHLLEYMFQNQIKIEFLSNKNINKDYSLYSYNRNRSSSLPDSPTNIQQINYWSGTLR